jgi:hypothetical protein
MLVLKFLIRDELIISDSWFLFNPESGASIYKRTERNLSCIHVFL